jgi:hypothetical protein
MPGHAAGGLLREREGQAGNQIVTGYFGAHCRISLVEDLLFGVTSGSIKLSDSNDFKVVLRYCLTMHNPGSEGSGDKNETRKFIYWEKRTAFETRRENHTFYVISQPEFLPAQGRIEIHQRAMLTCIKKKLFDKCALTHSLKTTAV